MAKPLRAGRNAIGPSAGPVTHSPLAFPSPARTPRPAKPHTLAFPPLTMPTTPRTLDAAFAVLHATLGDPPEARQAVVQALRPLIDARRDPLAEAELQLLDAVAALGASTPCDDPDALMQAIRVFEVNDRPERLAQAWHLLAGVHAAQGHLAAALQAGRQALSLPELRIEGRLALAGVVIPSLVMLGEIDLAVLVTARDFQPYVAASRASRLGALAWTHLAGLHAALAYRAAQGGALGATAASRGAPTRSTLPAPVRVAHEVQRAREALARARALPAPPATAMLPVQALLDMLPSADAPAPDAPIGNALLAGWTGYLAACAHRRHGRHPAAVDALAPTLELARLPGSGALAAACHADVPGLPALAPVPDTAPPIDWMLVWRDAPDAPPGYQPVAAQATVAEVMHWRRTMPPYVRRALREAATTLDARLSLAEMAERVGVRPRTLQAGLRTYRDVTFLGAYRDAALAEATRLLRRTSLPIAEVAVRVGYGSSAAFSRDFRSTYGVPPSTLRGRSSH